MMSNMVASSHMWLFSLYLTYEIKFENEFFMRYRKAKASLLSGHWDHPPGLACSLSSPLSPKSLSLCEPAPSVGRESWPLFPLCPLTPCVHPHLSVYTSCPEQAGHISLGNVSWGAVLTEEPHSHPSLLFKATEVRKSITHHPLSLAHPLAPSAKSLCCFGFFFFLIKVKFT